MQHVCFVWLTGAADLKHADDRCRAVERRAGKVHDDYVKAAAKLDAAHCGTLPGARPGRAG